MIKNGSRCGSLSLLDRGEGFEPPLPDPKSGVLPITPSPNIIVWHAEKDLNLHLILVLRKLSDCVYHAHKREYPYQ